MLRNMLKRAASGHLIAGTPNAGIIASQIIAETATGDSGPGLLYDDALANTGCQLRAKITSWSGTPGTLTVWENGSALIEGEVAGSYVIDYDREAWSSDGSVSIISDTAFVQVGPLGATALGAVLAGAGVIVGGAASGEQNATAPGATLLGAASIEPGAADGQGNATAPGATLSGTATIVPGEASGEQNATAPGADLTGAAAIIPGAAIGEGSGDATAPGAVLVGTGQIVPGAAEGQQDASAPGAVLTGSGSLQPGAASGDLDGTAPGATLVGGGQFVPGNASDGTSDPVFALAVSIEKRTQLGLAAGYVTAYLWQEIALENVYYKGGVARLHCRVADSDGRDIDPPALSLMMRYGDGVPSELVYGVDAEIVRAGQGRYYADVPLTERGKMYGRWETGALDTGAAEFSIVVRGGRFL